jgi:hypothetical protein
MLNWKHFSEANPSMAKTGEEILFQFGVGLAFMATIRKDGAPRLHPLCPVLSQGKLYILVAPASPKKWDLLRDGRYAMQTFPQARPDSDEFYFTGIATAVEDQGIFESVIADARHVASEEEVLFELLVNRVMHTRWEGFGTPDYKPIHEKWSAGTD